MPLKLIKNRFSISVLLGLATAAILTMLHERPSSQIISKKIDFTNSNKSRSIASKLNAMMEIIIEPVSGIPDNDEQELTLKATLTLLRPIDSDLNYKWILPENVSIVAGHLEDGWSKIQVGQSVTTEITITGLSKESPGKAAILHVESSSQGTNVGYSGVFAVDPDSVAVFGAGAKTSNATNGAVNKLEKSKEDIYAERLKGINF